MTTSPECCTTHDWDELRSRIDDLERAVSVLVTIVDRVIGHVDQVAGTVRASVMGDARS